MSAWILWTSVMRMGYPEIGPSWRTKPDIYDSKEACQMAMTTAVAQYVEGLKNRRDIVEIMTVTDGYVKYVINDTTHPSGKRIVVARWNFYPAGFNPNAPH